MRYQSTPSIIEAVSWSGGDPESCALFAQNKVRLVSASVDPHEGPRLELLAGKDGAQGWVPVPLGHWLVKNPGDDSDIWPVDPDYFAGKYEPIGGYTLVGGYDYKAVVAELGRLGLETFLATRDEAREMLRVYGQVRADEAMGAGDSWSALAALDWMVEHGECVEQSEPGVWAQHRVFVRAAPETLPFGAYFVIQAKDGDEAGAIAAGALDFINAAHGEIATLMYVDNHEETIEP